MRSYIFWTHERGSLHYDVMVTLILAFIFLTPLWVNFKDKPVAAPEHQSGVVVVPDGKGGFIYQIEAADVEAADEASLREQLLRIVEPIAGEVEIDRYELVRDARNNPLLYRVWVRRY
ncbi:MAG TPA: hypothetical protein VFA60_03575 [Terriglobales bacterium]|nr:hypothetical protein [Terriglobales bacterium]